MSALSDKIRDQKLAAEAQAKTGSQNSSQNSNAGAAPAPVPPVNANNTQNFQPPKPDSKMKQDGSDTIHTSDLSTQQRQTSELDDVGVNQFIYSTPLSEGWGIFLSSGEIRAKDGVLKVNKAQHDELQALIKSGRADIAQNCVLLDVKAAEAIAKEHQLKMQQAKPAAIKGAVGSGHNAERIGEHRDVHPPRVPGSEANANIQSASAQAILAAAVEEDAVHAEDSALNPDPTRAADLANNQKS